MGEKAVSYLYLSIDHRHDVGHDCEHLDGNEHAVWRRTLGLIDHIEPYCNNNHNHNNHNNNNNNHNNNEDDSNNHNDKKNSNNNNNGKNDNSNIEHEKETLQ